MASPKKPKLSASMANVSYTNAVYFPNDRIYKGDTPGQLNYGCVNQVYYAYAAVSPDGSVFLSDEWADAKAPVDGVNGGLGSLMHLKQKHRHLQVILSVGGANAAAVFPVVAASTLSRDNFARSARGLVEASGLDGIDVAWEWPNDARQGHDFLSLLAAVRIHLPEDRFFLSAALPAHRALLRHVDLGAAAEYVDRVNLMAFDLFGSWSRAAGHHAQLYAIGRDAADEDSGSAAVACLLSRGVPASKILFGVPVYGRSFLAATGPGQPFSGGGGDAGTFEYRALPRPGAAEVVDKRHIAAQCVGADGGFVSYDNPETVKAKATFCKQKGLAGLFYHHGAIDSQDRSRSLIAAGFRTLHTS
ncbi:hypothetical protein N3K66_005623 [Trichothecium roseum]|uniref:Uncharacterized protein n=1 Tax=Trichothecium roseum TaxID=47278 RepID=A0ACC0V087_9HYPO|nr:hypothetical protein N3K66_005623 [Trichothecium roseum]